jgi:hypothetical protein
MGRHEAPNSPKDESRESAPDGHREPRGKHARDSKDKGGKKK